MSHAPTGRRVSCAVRKILDGLWLPVAVLALPLIIQAISVARLPVVRLVQAVPDDAFYYLVLARNRASSGLWSFDHTAPATGFHLAYAYLLFALDAAFPGLTLEAQVWIILWSVVCGLLVAFASLLRAVEGSMRTGIAAGLLLLLASPTGRLQAVLLMETPLVIIAAALLCAVILRAGAGRAGYAWAIGVGALGSFARTEFALLPAALLAASLVLGYANPKAGVLIRKAGAALVGSILGICVVTLHATVIGGGLFQSSALIKRHWGQLFGYDPWPAVLLLAQLGDPRYPQPWFLCLAMGVVAAAALLVWQFVGSHAWRVAILGMVIFIPAAILIYGFEPIGLQIWYFGMLFVPLAVCAAAIVARLPPWATWSVAGCAAMLAVLSSLSPPMMLWPNQTSMWLGGLLLRDEPRLAPVGNWNSGIVSWFSGRDVTNLDGLVNDEIYAYASSDRLDAYLERRGIQYVLDLPVILHLDGLERFQGMSCGRLSRRLAPIRTVGPDPSAEPTAMNVTLYRFLPHAPDYPMNEIIDFGTAGNAASYEGCGWNPPDAESTQLNDNRPATLLLPLEGDPAGPLEVELNADAETPAVISVTAQNEPVARWVLAPGRNHLHATIAKPRLDNRVLELDFRQSDTAGSVSVRSVVLLPKSQE